MILGGYELGPEVGSGAMGTVHLAHDLRTQTVVAVKRIHPKYTGQKQTLRRFAVEVQAAGRLRHPNIASVIASGTEPRGTPYCVMEWVSGQPLTRWAQSQLPWQEIAWIVSDLLDALAYAHARGVVHRDLKPANILVERPFRDDPRMRLVDFGIARLLEAEEEDVEATALTMDDRVVGTPAYLSPEQAQGHGHLIGPHTDLYALGVIVYELVAGHLPFHGMPMVQLLMAHATKPPPPLDLSNRPDVPREVISAIRWLLEKSPDARPHSAQEVRGALGLPDRVARYPLPKVPGCEEEVSPDEVMPTAIASLDEQASQEAIQMDRSRSQPDLGAPRPGLDVDAVPQFVVERVTLLGRDDEVTRLMGLAQQILATRRSGLAIVRGEAGIGKSRLVQELRYRLEESGSYRGVRILGRSGVSEDDPMRVLIARLLLAERLRGEALKERLDSVADLYYFSPLQVRALTSWLSYDYANQGDVAERIDLAARVLKKVASYKPLVCIFEGGDLLGSNFALAVLNRILTTNESDALVFAVVTARESLEHLPLTLRSLYLQLNEDGRAIDVPLGPLSDEILAELVRPLVTAHAEEIAHSAKGSPLFALELARLRAGATVTTTEQFLTVPATLGEIWKQRIQRTLRLAGEPELARCALIAAALLGPSVRRRVLVTLVAQALNESHETVESAIDIWTSTGVLMDDGRRDPTLSFVNMVAYEYVSDDIDTDNHSVLALLVRIADWVTERKAGVDPDVLRTLAGVLEDGGDFDRANQIRLLAGELLVGRLEYQGAQKEFEKLRASALVLSNRDLEVAATSELANLHVLRGDLEAAEDCLSRLDAPAFDHLGAEVVEEETATSLSWVGWLQAKANLMLAQGRPQQAVDLLDQAVRLAKRGDDSLRLANVRTQFSHALELSGEMADAERQCRFAIRTLEKSEAPQRLRAGVSIELARLCREQGRTDEALEAANKALPLAERAGDRRKVDKVLEVLLWLADDRGDFDEAVAHGERILEQQRTFGDRVGMIQTENTLGVLERHRANLAEALEHHGRSLSLLQELPDPRMQALNQENLGLLHRRQKKASRAVDVLQQAGELFEQSGDRVDFARVWGHLSLVMRSLGHRDRAERLVREALRIQYELNDLTGQARSQTVLGLLASDSANWSIAREMFAEARTTFASMGVYSDLILAETWLALTESALGNQQACDMLARDIEERLRVRPVYRNTLVEGLDLLVEAVDAHNRDLAWDLQDRSRALNTQLSRTRS